jgi:predicted ester cyclase
MQALTPKEVVCRFNLEVIERGRREVFLALMAKDFVNHSASPGAPSEGEGMWNTFENILRPAIADLRVTIEDQLVDGDKVTTRKAIEGTLIGPLLGREPNHAPIRIEVIDIVRVRDGQYVEHWGINNLPLVLAKLESAAD